MKQFFRYLFKIFYASDTVGKYKSGYSYIMALLIGTFYIMMTLMLLFSVALAISPHLYRSFLLNIDKVNSKLFALAVFAVIFFFLRVVVKEDTIKDTSLQKEEVNRVVNYLLAYLMIVVVIIGILGLKFLRHYKNAM